jgi:hypothetical protein
MAARSPAPDRLKELLEEQSAQARRYAHEVPFLRAAAGATSAALTQLAETPPGTPLPRRTYVDIVLDAPDRGWAEKIAARLRSELPDAQVNLGPSSAGLQAAPPPSGYVVRCEVSWPGQARDAKGAVRKVLAGMSDVEVDYSEPIDLVVVRPSGYAGLNI